MKLKFTSAVIFVLINTIVLGQEIDVNENCKSAYTDILSLRFNNALKKVNSEKVHNSDNVYADYLLNYIDFLKVTISEDETLYRNIENNIDFRINRINQLPDSSPYKKYLLANINLQWATVSLRFENYITGALKVNRAYRLLEDNYEEFPRFFPNKITLGVLHIMIGIVPDSYHWLLNLVSMNGTVEQGRQELSLAYDSCHNNPEYKHLTNEILFYMGMVDLNLSPDPRYADYLFSKIDSSNTNLLLSYLAINTRIKNFQNDEALKIFKSIDYTQDYYPFYYLDYIKGECYLRKLETENAIRNYRTFLQNFTGTNYIKDAWQKIGWCHLINGDTAGYAMYMDSALVSGDTKIDADKNAELAGLNKTLPSVSLLVARMFSDGGYFSKSDSVLNTISNPDTREKVEIYYRMARNAHQTNNIDDAIKFYKLTIDIGKVFQFYFAANSALKLGNIYEQKNELDKSVYYYELCLDLDFNQYRNSIRGKAKQGLERVERK